MIPKSDRIPDWQDKLVYAKLDKPARSVGNVIAVLMYHPEWRKKIRLNRWTGEIEIHGQLPWQDMDMDANGPTWTDEDSILLQTWMGNEVHPSFIVGRDTVYDAVIVVAKANGYDPVIDWMSSLKWDGVHRLDSWTQTYLGAEDTDAHRLAGKWWLISAVARAFQPGCPAQHMLVLEGPQGIGKSTALKTLGGDWFTDTPFAIGDKDSYMTIAGSLIVEFAELSSVRRSKDVESVKSFITQAEDKFRAPYGRVVKTVKRRCVLAGSVNDSQYLSDPSGNRRFWPVKCTSVDVDGLRRMREQLFAEAVSEYRAGTKWFPENNAQREIMREQQAQRTHRDAWIDPIEKWISELRRDAIPSADPDALTIPDVLAGGLKIEHKRDWDRAAQMRVADCLRELGYDRHQIREGAIRKWVYRPSPPPEPGTSG